WRFSSSHKRAGTHLTAQIKQYAILLLAGGALVAPLDHGAAQSLLGEGDLVQQMHGPLVHDTTDTPYARVSVEGAAISLADAVAVAIVRHPDVAQAAAALARGRADLGAARSVWLPSVSYSANIGP